MALDYLFRPRSIAVVGASRNREKVGNVLFRNISSTFRGKVYPVNNKSEVIEGVKSFKSLKDIQDDIDLVVVSVPRESVKEVMEEAGEKNVKSAIVITSGFREVGEDGERLEKELVEVAHKHGIRFLGPNTMGLLTPDYNGTFAFADVRRGEIALVVQSGGIGAYMLNWAQRSRTGISFLVSLGNQSDVREYEIIDYLSRDPETKAIFVYIEGISDGEKFLQTMPDATSRKPVIFIKGGATAQSAEAVKTHTGSLAGSYEIFKAAIRTVGGIFVENLRDFLDLSKLVNSSEPIRNEILVVTNSGGHGVLTSDAIYRSGLSLVKIPERLNLELRNVLPPQSLAKNPLDLSGDAGRDRYLSALKIVSDLDCTKLVIVQSLPFISCTEVAKVLLNFKGKGIIGVTMGYDEDSASRILESASIPVFTFPEEAVRAISTMVNKPTPRRKVRISQPINSALELTNGKSVLSDYDGLKLMELYGIRTPKWGLAESYEDAQRIADSIGYPVVMKISTDQPVHKTELKGVYMNVERDAIKDTFSKLTKISKRVMIQEQLTGLEAYVGGIKDPVFGHTVVVGVGGIYLEVLKSVSYGIAPVYEDEAVEMVKESKLLDMITARKRGYDQGSLIRTVSNVSRLILDLNVKEMDINPLIVNDKGAFAVDVRVVF
ncbi:MAG: acetate--CoA ligase family protein [Metallosphaera sp.]|uniref:CoA-binding domain-containing protein n=1 Tax=Metallosphaera cuprina (strain Ar-4) TaxID=1006006 RepID=F4G293_METCR|nr:acetate--CoA ligase [Metallosphaera cuprina]AEB94941.1 CoA-binding domain-containing protein [Metallosphaera cuprina Ar-4]